MTRIAFTYYEVIDKDFTGIVATVRSSKHRPQHFANFDRFLVPKPMYANQTEEFRFPSRASALSFLQSNRGFRPIRSPQLPHKE